MNITLIIFQAGAGDRNSRAMSGARLLGDALATRIGTTPARVGHTVAPLGGSWQRELVAAQPNLRKLAESIDRALSMQPALTPVSTLSRCAVALATLPIVAKHRPDACVVWFDAHGDLNTPQTTKTGYLGGMVLTGAAGLWESGLGRGLELSNVVLVGARDLDPAEQALIDADTPQLVTSGPGLADRLRSAIAGRPVYVHLDCDVLEPGIVPTEYSVPGGLSLDDLHAACRVIAQHEIVGLEIAELEATPDDPAGLMSTSALVGALEPLITSWTGLQGRTLRPTL